MFSHCEALILHLCFIPIYYIGIHFYVNVDIRSHSVALILHLCFIPIYYVGSHLLC